MIFLGIEKSPGNTERWPVYYVRQRLGIRTLDEILSGILLSKSKAIMQAAVQRLEVEKDVKAALASGLGFFTFISLGQVVLLS